MRAEACTQPASAVCKVRFGRCVSLGHESRSGRVLEAQHDSSMTTCISEMFACRSQAAWRDAVQVMGDISVEVDTLNAAIGCLMQP